MTSGSQGGVKYNRKTLHKVERIFEELDFQILYEKGQFLSGYCLMENKKLVVINRFFDKEARIGCLIDILKNIEFEMDILSVESKEYCANVLISHWATQRSDI